MIIIYVFICSYVHEDGGVERNEIKQIRAFLYDADAAL